MIIVAASHSPIGFAPVKAILNHLGIHPQSLPPEIEASFRIFYPLDVGLAERVRSLASLTDAATPEEQIRFFQSQRANRSFIKLTDHVISKFPGIEVVVSSSYALDPGSRSFFDIASRISGWKVIYRPEDEPGAITYKPVETERSVLDWIQSSPQKVKQLQDAAYEYVNVGDAWTAVRFGNALQVIDTTARTWNLLALAHAMLSDTLKAEFYYNRWIDVGTPLDRVRAMYGLSMLYARHHPRGLLSVDKSAAILEEAYEIVSGLADEESADDTVVFDKVFNRNGYALTLFRKGNVSEATDLLRWGIDTLKGTTEKVSIHRTVLMYNLAQCLKQSGDLAGAIRTYEQLLDVDPHMPEYHLEFAKCLAAERRNDAALDACEKALDLDDTIAPGWALKGLYLSKAGQYANAVTALQEAVRLDPGSINYALDLAYNLAMACSYRSLLDVLKNWHIDDIAEADAERLISLRAEALVNLGNSEQALDALQTGLNRFPESAVLHQNHDLVSSNYA